jgi:hypothetical protein
LKTLHVSMSRTTRVTRRTRGLGDFVTTESV